MPSPTNNGSNSDRIRDLEDTVADLRRQIDQLLASNRPSDAFQPVRIGDYVVGGNQVNDPTSLMKFAWLNPDTGQLEPRAGGSQQNFRVNRFTDRPFNPGPLRFKPIFRMDGRWWEFPLIPSAGIFKGTSVIPARTASQCYSATANRVSIDPTSGAITYHSDTHKIWNVALAEASNNGLWQAKMDFDGNLILDFEDCSADSSGGTGGGGGTGPGTGTG